MIYTIDYICQANIIFSVKLVQLSCWCL